MHSINILTQLVTSKTFKFQNSNVAIFRMSYVKDSLSRGIIYVTEVIFNSLLMPPGYTRVWYALKQKARNVDIFMSVTKKPRKMGCIFLMKKLTWIKFERLLSSRENLSYIKSNLLTAIKLSRYSNASLYCWISFSRVLFSRFNRSISYIIRKTIRNIPLL